jgi:xanthine dehydrogenase accessory factor
MYEVVEDIARWFDEGESILLATVVRTWGSSPRIPGAKMAFTPSGKVSGSVSGGCVEGAVIQEGLDALRQGRSILLHYGVADETAMEVGLACGGQIDIYVQPLSRELFNRLRAPMSRQEPVVLLTVTRGSQEVFGQQAVWTPESELPASIPVEWSGAAEALASEAATAQAPLSRQIQYQNQAFELFADPILPPLSIVLVGGAHISVALAQLAKAAGFRTTVIDPRRAFGSPERFPGIDQLIQTWPDDAFQQVRLDPSTAIVMLTHDPKIDDPALAIALSSPAFYIGALGSRKTQAARRQRLLEAGFEPGQLDRIHGPVGLEIGARLPEEIAVSILAEIIAVRRGSQR